MIKLYTNFHYHTEILDVVKMFFCDVIFCDVMSDADITLAESSLDEEYNYKAVYIGKEFSTTVNTQGADDLQAVRLRKRFAKLAMYNLLSGITGVKLPWGSLTGIRPTKLACQLQKEGLDWKDSFQNLLGVSKEKTLLIDEILNTQGNFRFTEENSADLYIGIPFCVTRCSYCSFTSGEIGRLGKYVEPYIDSLKKDIRATVKFAESIGIKLKNVYIGGGTPTSLTAGQLDDILDEIDFVPQEFTVEAGRPDTVDGEKLQVFKKHGVDRVSINPQSFNQSVLDVIGRKHSVQDIYEKFALTKSYGFIVNMDLIAGLPIESYEMFCYGINEAIKLSPDNITVHTLALKKGSLLKEQHYTSQSSSVSDMVDYARKQLSLNGYSPYYLYRQKYMMENLENVGYCKPSVPCLYNIGIMEELTNILACGTNAISKRIISAENRIERSANAKDVITYIERTDEYLKDKFDLFSK